MRLVLELCVLLRLALRAELHLHDEPRVVDLPSLLLWLLIEAVVLGRLVAHHAPEHPIVLLELLLLLHRQYYL